MRNKFIYLFPFIIYLGIGLKIKFEDITLLLGLSVFFTLSLYIFSFLYSFIGIKKTRAIVVDANYGYTDMKRGASNRYYLKYIFNNKEYIKRLIYSTSSSFKIGDEVEILVNSNNAILISKDFKYLIFFDIFIFLGTIFFLIQG